MENLKFRIRTWKKFMYQEDQYLSSFIRRWISKIKYDTKSFWSWDHEKTLPWWCIDWYMDQWIGLLDKNWKEIYTWDIVEWIWRQWVMIFEDWRFFPKSNLEYSSIAITMATRQLIIWDLESWECKVIWNVRENLDLLNKDQWS